MRAFAGCSRLPLDEIARHFFPIAEVFRDQPIAAAADQVEQARGRIAKHGAVAAGHERLEVFLEMDSVGARGAENPAPPLRLVLVFAAAPAVRVEHVVDAVVPDAVAGAHRAFPLLDNRHRQGVFVPRYEIAARQLAVLVRPLAPLAAVMAPIEQVEQAERALVEHGHAIAGPSVVAARFPILGRGLHGAVDLALAPGDFLRPTGQRDDLLVAERAVPDGHVIDLAAEAGPQLALFVSGADQQWGAEAGELAMRPLFVDKHAIDEQFQVRPAEPHEDVVPRVSSDQRHRHAEPQNPVEEILAAAASTRGEQARAPAGAGRTLLADDLRPGGVVPLPDRQKRELAAAGRQHGGAFEELLAAEADDGFSAQPGGGQLRLTAAIVLHHAAAEGRFVPPDRQRARLAGSAAVRVDVGGVQVQHQSPRRGRRVRAGNALAQAPLQPQAAFDRRSLRIGQHPVIDENLGDLALQEFAIVVLGAHAENGVADVLPGAVDRPGSLLAIVKQGHHSLGIQAHRAHGELARLVRRQVVLVVAFTVEPVHPRGGAELAQRAALDRLGLPQVVQRAIAPVEKIGVLAGRVVAADERRRPVCGRIPQSHGESHLPAGNGQRPFGRGPGAKIAAAEFGNPAVASAAQRSGALGAGEFPAELDGPFDRQHAARLRRVSRRIHVPDGHGVIQRSAGGCRTQAAEGQEHDRNHDPHGLTSLHFDTLEGLEPMAAGPAMFPIATLVIGQRFLVR